MYVINRNSALARAALFVLGYFVVLVACSVLKGMAPKPYADLVWGCASSLGLLAMTWRFLRFDRRTFADVGMRHNASSILRLLAGLALGAAVYIVALIIISTTLGPLQLSAPTWPSAWRWMLAIASFLSLSCMEELGFRGYVLRTLMPAVGVWPAQVLIAIAFGFTHIAYGWPLTTVLIGVIPSALLFGAVAWRSGGLAMPIGVHAAMNIAQWMVGEKEAAGVWTLSSDPALASRLASGAPIIATSTTLAAAIAVMCWPSPRETH